MTEFFDTHAHLDFPDFAGDLEAVVARATEAGITRILSIGTTLAGSRRVLEIAERFPSVYAVVGVHPNHAEEEPDQDLRPALIALAAHPRVVGIGETGLDFYRLEGRTPEQVERMKARQAEVFGQQLEVASALGLPCVIHQRAAFAETMAQMAPFQGRTRGVFHCFTGTVEEARAVIEAGQLVSFTGITTFKNAQNVRDALAAVPDDRFMLETDCPFLAPVPHRSRRCEPAYVRPLAEVVATVRGWDLETLSQRTCATARGFFTRLG